MDVQPVTDGFGIEIRDVDLAACGPAMHHAVVALFNRHGMVIIRDQSLPPEAQMAFTRAFGTPETNQRLDYTYPGIPEILVISNKIVDGRRIGDIYAGLGWHTDSSYLEEPVLCTMLYALEVPDEGGDTILADLCAARTALPPERQAQLHGLKVQHSWRSRARKTRGTLRTDSLTLKGGGLVWGSSHAPILVIKRYGLSAGASAFTASAWTGPLSSSASVS